MRKLIATLFAAICLITAFGQVDSLKNASLIGQASRNQKVGQGFQIGFVGSSDDTCQINTKLQIVPNAGAGKVLTSDANGFATWTPLISATTWTDSAGALFPTVLENNVGIGTATPTARFAVNFGDSVVQRIDSFGYDYFGNITAPCPSCTTAYNIMSIGYNGSKGVAVNGISDTNAGTEIIGISTDNVGLSLNGGSTNGTGLSITSSGATGMYIVAGSVADYGVRIDGGGNVDSAAIWLNSVSGTLRITGSGEGNGKVLTSDAAGNATWQSSDALFTVDSVATTGDTVDMATNTYTAIIASGAITDLMLRFPASPSNGDVVVAKFDFAVTTLTSDGQGKTIYGFPTSTILGQHREWRYDATTGAWY